MRTPSIRVLIPLATIGLALLAIELTARAQVQGQTVPRRSAFACQDGRVPIGALPFTIDVPGSYFVTGALTGVAGQNGITITSDDVTLDLNGFTLAGVAGSAHGIEVQAARNVAIRAGHLQGWGGDGVQAAAVTGGSLSDLQASSNGGSGLTLGSGGVARGCTASSNGADGVVVGFGGSVLDCAASGNARDGVVGAISALATGCTIVNCSSRGNGEDGIETGDGCTVTGCTTALNGQDGIEVGNSSVVTGCAATLNTGRGIAAFNALIRGNAVRGNAGGQIAAPGSTVLENH